MGRGIRDVRGAVNGSLECILGKGGGKGKSRQRESKKRTVFIKK
jgi:hypothetical protein